jgi:N-acetylmuramoyl-L-alanine amidase
MLKAENIDKGHTLTGGDTGAKGINGILEQNLTRQLGSRVEEKLKMRSHKVYDCTVDNTVDGQRGLSNSINTRINNCNSNEVDFNIVLHFNCSNGQGNGSEIFTWNGEKLPEAERILKNFEKIGLRNRGIKENNSLGLINGTKAPTLYIETLFIDNQHDYDILATKGLDILAEAIVCGLLNKSFELDKQPDKRDNKIIIKEIREALDELERNI